MQRSSETIGAIAAALAKAAGRDYESREVAYRHHPFAVPTRRRPDVPLRLLVERVGDRTQMP